MPTSCGLKQSQSPMTRRSSSSAFITARTICACYTLLRPQSSRKGMFILQLSRLYQKILFRGAYGWTANHSGQSVIMGGWSWASTKRIFADALSRAGWTATKKVWPELGWAAVWVARRIGSEQERVASCPPARTSVDTRNVEEQLRAELDAVYGSTSWRLTAPLRAAKRRLSFR